MTKIIFISLILAILGIASCNTVAKNRHHSSNEDLKRQTYDVIETDNSSFEECAKYYGFQGEFIDLDDMILFPDTLDIEEVYQTCSKYRDRFETRDYSEVFNPLCACAIYKDKEKGEYKISWNKRDDNHEHIWVEIPIERPLPEVYDYSFKLFSTKDNNIILFIKDFYGTHYQIYKYDSNGNIIDSTELEHTYVTHPEPNTDYHHPYLYFYDETDDYIVFSSGSFYSEKDKTILFRKSDFVTTEYDISLSGLIYDESDRIIIGLAEHNDKGYRILMLDGREFNISKEFTEPACSFVLIDNLLYVAHYHPISTGSALFCYDISKKEVLWTADVKQVNASHSEYYNEVILLTYKDKIIMHGIESYAEYLQIFDAITGERLASFGDFFEWE